MQALRIAQPLCVPSWTASGLQGRNKRSAGVAYGGGVKRARPCEPRAAAPFLVPSAKPSGEALPGPATAAEQPAAAGPFLEPSGEQLPPSEVAAHQPAAAAVPLQPPVASQLHPALPPAVAQLQQPAAASLQAASGEASVALEGNTELASTEPPRQAEQTQAAQQRDQPSHEAATAMPEQQEEGSSAQAAPEQPVAPQRDSTLPAELHPMLQRLLPGPAAETLTLGEVHSQLGAVLPELLQRAQHRAGASGEAAGPAALHPAAGAEPMDVDAPAAGEAPSVAAPSATQSPPTLVSTALLHDHAGPSSGAVGADAEPRAQPQAEQQQEGHEPQGVEEAQAERRPVLERLEELGAGLEPEAAAAQYRALAEQLVSEAGARPTCSRGSTGHRA